MITKILELRDKGTFIPVLAILMKSSPPNWNDQNYLLMRAGYAAHGRDLVLLTNANGGRRAEYDPFSWGDRTYHIAHEWITEHFAELNDGDVVDVEFILGESATPKLSERVEDAIAAAEEQAL